MTFAHSSVRVTNLRAASDCARVRDSGTCNASDRRLDQQSLPLAWSARLVNHPCELRGASWHTGMYLVGTSRTVTTTKSARANDQLVGGRLALPGVPAMFAFRDQDGNGIEIIEVS